MFEETDMPMMSQLSSTMMSQMQAEVSVTVIEFLQITQHLIQSNHLHSQSSQSRLLEKEPLPFSSFILSNQPTARPVPPTTATQATATQAGRSRSTVVKKTTATKKTAVGKKKTSHKKVSAAMNNTDGAIG